jgi:hypothetical protein
MREAYRRRAPTDEPAPRPEAEPLVFHLPVHFKRRSGRREIVFPSERAADQAAGPAAHRPLVLALARAHRWLELIENGRFAGVAELAEAVGTDPSFVRRALSLTLLNPRLVERILVGTEPDGVSLETLVRGVPVRWDDQPE